MKKSLNPVKHLRKTTKELIDKNFLKIDEKMRKENQDQINGKQKSKSEKITDEK